MPNLSTSLILYQIFDSNDQIICSGNCPYDLLGQVWTLTETPTSETRTLKFNIDGNWFTLNPVGYPLGLDQSASAYQAIVDYEILNAQALQDAEAMRLWQQQLDIEKTNNESNHLQAQAIDAFNQYKEMLVAQNQLTQDQADAMQAEQLRQDENRIALVRGIALDPTTAPGALASEFGQNGDIRRQVAAVMEADINISKLVVQTSSTYWMSSYEVMAVIGSQCTEDREFAQLVSDKLPDNSSLKIMLKGFGWAT
jgi:hypothetical protein